MLGGVADAANGRHRGIAPARARLVDQADRQRAVLARHVDATDVVGAVGAGRLGGVVAEQGLSPGAVAERGDAARSR
jgi:hypothetical protein